MLLILIGWSLLCISIGLHFINNPARRRDVINVLFALPGGGKSTFAVYLVQKYCKKKVKVYGNFGCSVDGYTRIEYTDLGRYLFEDCVIIIDEAGIDFNNRRWKELSAEMLEFLKTHRHYKCELWFISQSPDDIDITVRRLAHSFYTVSHTVFHRITKRFVVKRYRKVLYIDKDKHDFIYGVDKVALSSFRFSGRKCFKYFDSFERKPLPALPMRSSKASTSNTIYSFKA